MPLSTPLEVPLSGDEQLPWECEQDGKGHRREGLRSWTKRSHRVSKLLAPRGNLEHCWLLDPLKLRVRGGFVVKDSGTRQCLEGRGVGEVVIGGEHGRTEGRIPTPK